MHKKYYNLSEIDQIATFLLENTSHHILLFYGDMGVGKTTLIKSIAKTLQVIDNVSSPTFSLVNEYQTKDGKTIYHFDFYRIKNEIEALDMGVEEYFDSDALCLVEWPEKIAHILPENHLKVFLTKDKNENREISFLKK